MYDKGGVTHQRATIVARPTVSAFGQPVSPADPEASLRAELLGQIVAAQFDLEDALAELERSGAPTDALRSSLQSLGDLQRQIGVASPAALLTLRGEIAASASTGRAIAQQSRIAASSDSADDQLAATSARTRATIQRIGEDLFERRVLDSYLQFDSEVEERAYRQREAERQEYIRRELAKDTPEGARNAAAATVAQLDDARDHGADRSPAFDSMYGAAVNARDEQIAAMAPTEERALAPSQSQSPQPSATNAELDEIAAIFKSAGVLPPPAEPAEQGNHGLANVAVERGGNNTGRSA